MKASFLILLLTFSISAQTIEEGKRVTNWQFVEQGREINTKAYYGTETVRRNGNVIKVWAKWDFPAGLSNDLLGSEGVKWRGPTIGSFRTHLTLSCQEKYVKARNIIVYDLYGSIVQSEKGREQIAETPGSIGQAIFNYFCEREPPPPSRPPKLKPTPSKQP